MTSAETREPCRSPLLCIRSRVAWASAAEEGVKYLLRTLDMAAPGLSLPDFSDRMRSWLDSLMPAASTQDLSSASGHHMMLPNMPHVMMPELASIAETMPLLCAWNNTM